MKFSYECFDRFITNCIAQPLQYENGLSRYLFEEYGTVSREAVKARTARFHEQMEEIAKRKCIEIKKIDKRISLLELAKKELRKMEPIPDNEDSIVAIFKHVAYGNSWNFNSKKKTLQRKPRRVYHYTVYHIDMDFGLGSHTLNTYLPNNIRGYFNQHNWIIQQLKHQGLYNDDIKMYYNSFQDIGTIDHDNFQSLCDSITYDQVLEYDCKWISALWSELGFLPYRSYINEAEFCSNLIFKQKSFLNRFYLNHILFAYDLSLPENLSFIFNRRIDKRYKNPFKTNLRIVETKPCLKVSYKSQQYKEYLKNLDLRSESTVNNAMDLGLNKSDLKGIRDKCRDINERAIGIQQPVDPNWIRQELDHNPFERVKVGEKWIAGIKINDEKIVAVMKGLSQSKPMGISMRGITDFVNEDQGKSSDDGFKLPQIGYVLRKLRAHDLAGKVKGKNLYRLTHIGSCFVKMFISTIEKVILPLTSNIQRLAKGPRCIKNKYQAANNKKCFLKNLNVIYKSIERNITDLFDHLDVGTTNRTEV